MAVPEGAEINSAPCTAINDIVFEVDVRDPRREVVIPLRKSKIERIPCNSHDSNNSWLYNRQYNSNNSCLYNN